MGFYIDFSLAFSLLLIMNSFQYNILGKVYLKKINHKMADFSYSLYLFHFPFFVFAISFLYLKDIHLLLMQPTIINLGYYFILICLIYTYSYISFLFFERNTHIMQKFISNL